MKEKRHDGGRLRVGVEQPDIRAELRAAEPRDPARDDEPTTRRRRRIRRPGGRSDQQKDDPGDGGNDGSTDHGGPPVMRSDASSGLGVYRRSGAIRHGLGDWGTWGTGGL